MDQDNDHDGVSNVNPAEVLSPHIDDVKSERQSDLLSPVAADRILSSDRKKIVDFNKYEEIVEQKEQVLYVYKRNQETIIFFNDTILNNVGNSKLENLLDGRKRK